MQNLVFFCNRKKCPFPHIKNEQKTEGGLIPVTNVIWLGAAEIYLLCVSRLLF